MKRRFFCYRDGLKIVGTVFFPKGRKENYPAIIISHEFMANRFFSYPYAKALVKEGYAVFCYDFCGGGIISASDGSSTEMSVLTEVEDLKAVIAYVSGLPYINEKELILIGCSQGGLVSALVAASLGEKIKRLVLFYPALSIPDDVRAGKMLMVRFDPSNIPDRFRCGTMLLGKCYANAVMEMDAYSIIPLYKGDVLIIHGTHDGLVDISYSRKVIEAYKKASSNRIVSLKEIRGAGHIFTHHKYIRDAIISVKEFLLGYVELTQVDIRLTGINCKVKKNCIFLTIPFKGVANGEMFSGEILPNAYDERRYPLFRPAIICAKYSLIGMDNMKNQCTVSVENRTENRCWKPFISSDNERWSFSDGVNGHAYVRQRGLKGPIVRLFVLSKYLHYILTKKSNCKRKEKKL